MDARRFLQGQQGTSMLEVLRRVVQGVNAAEDLETALDLIVSSVQREMDCNVCSVYLLDPKQNKYVLMATRGLNADAIGRVMIGAADGLVGLVGQRAEPINLHDAPSHPHFLYIDELGEEPFHSFLGTPIIEHKRVLGVLVVQDRDSRRYNADEEAFLITLAGRLGGRISHASATGALQDMTDANAPRTYSGTPSGAGVAIGTAYVLFPDSDLDSVPERPATDVAEETALFAAAVESTRAEIEDLSQKLSFRLQRSERALFDVYIQMLGEVEVEVTTRIVSDTVWAQGALKHVIDSHVATFDLMDDEYMRERGADVKDLGQRVLANLQRQTRGTPGRNFPDKTVLVADELTPAMLGEVPEECLVGVVSVSGSVTSHAAILAEAMGLPTVMGADDLPIKRVHASPIIVDGFDGVVITHPNESQERSYLKVMREEEELIEGLEGLRDEPAVTLDGDRVKLWVNTGLMTDVVRSLDRGAEGVGLYRTESYFMMRDRFPTEDEQREIYREHLKAFSPMAVTMRTLDIGGDKSLPYFPIEEENPFLGWRGIRVTLDHPEIFLSQVRAMISANEGIDGHLRIMVPMVSSVMEVDEAQRLIAQCYREIVEEGVEVEMPDIGVMIEVPAAVYQTRAILSRVDFLAVGSNDLIQYMLAVDRNNARVAELYQDFHPAVLHALQHVVGEARLAKKEVGICGEMAGNPAAAILLVAMGFDELSMISPNLPIIKWVIRSVEMKRARQILDTVLKMENAHLIKNYMDERLREFGLGRLIRSGRNH
jgi:phosphotransferase system enzyme I (PtsP)